MMQVKPWPTATCSGWRSTGAIGILRKLAEESGIPVDELEAMAGGSLQPARMNDWPTPSKRDYKDSPGMAKEGTNPDGSKRNRVDQLGRKVYDTEDRKYPTPQASDHTTKKTSASWKEQGSTNSTLANPDIQKEWPTPRCQMTRKTKEDRNKSNLEEKVDQSEKKGYLNPDWVEWLMGWPVFWTDLEPLPIELAIDWFNKHNPEDNGPLTWWLNDIAETPVGWEVLDPFMEGDKQPDEPYINRVGHEIAQRVNRLKAIGNGQVPAAAALAFVVLHDVLESRN